MKHHQISALCATLLALFLPALAAGQPASLLSDINSTTLDVDHPPYVAAVDLKAARNRLFFLAEAGGAGTELWTSDGTSAGTEIIRDLCPGFCNVYSDFYGALGKVMLFATDGENGQRQLWRWDGTRPGTFALTGPELNIFTYTAQDTPHQAFFHGALYFSGCPAAFAPDWVVAAGGRLFFLARDGGSEQVWTSDGTPAGTRKLTSFPGDDPFGSATWLQPEGNRSTSWRTTGSTGSRSGARTARRPGPCG